MTTPGRAAERLTAAVAAVERHGGHALARRAEDVPRTLPWTHRRTCRHVVVSAILLVILSIGVIAPIVVYLFAP